MNDYFRQGHLLVFTRFHTSEDCLKEDDRSTLEKIGILMEELGANCSVIHIQNSNPNQGWPDESGLNTSLSQTISDEFAIAFEGGARKVAGLFCCPTLLGKQQLEEAFLSLRLMDCCIGPRPDGGIYLLGMNRYYPHLLESRNWGDPRLCKNLIRDIGSQKQILYKLPGL
ncbi:MAG: hypothetical protein RLZZ630_1369 [Bacteroidota bacterium]|jgi:hypothetical protein